MLGGFALDRAPTRGVEPQGSIQNRSTKVGSDSYHYQVHVSGKLQGARSLPVIFLQGIGQRGTRGDAHYHLQAIRDHGLAERLMAHAPPSIKIFSALKCFIKSEKSNFYILSTSLLA